MKKRRFEADFNIDRCSLMVGAFWKRTPVRTETTFDNGELRLRPVVCIVVYLCILPMCLITLKFWSFGDTFPPPEEVAS